MRIARDGIPFIVAPAVVALLVAWWEPLAALPFALAALFSAWFFRDPERVSPQDPALILSPADGRVIVAERARVSVFLNVFDVHVCRSPMGGVVDQVQHVVGSFLAAYRADASEHNERTSIDVRDGARRIRLTLIAGLVARRIVCRRVAGERLVAGERVGLIRFGSRVDLDLPPGCEPVVRVGERVRAGETVLARFAVEPT